MSNIRRYDPFSIEPLGDMLQGMFRNLRLGAEADLPFKVDVTESDASYAITADLPGVKKEDINVSVDRGTVMITAKLEKASEVKEGDRVIRRSAIAARCSGPSPWTATSTQTISMPASRTACCGSCYPKRKRRRSSA